MTAVDSDGRALDGLRAWTRATVDGCVRLIVVPAAALDPPVAPVPPPCQYLCFIAPVRVGGPWLLVEVVARTEARHEVRIVWGDAAVADVRLLCRTCGLERAATLPAGASGGTPCLPAEFAPFRLPYAGRYPWLVSAAEEFAAGVRCPRCDGLSSRR